MSLSQRALFVAGTIILLAIAGIWSGGALADVWRWPTALLLLAMAWERYRLPRHFRMVRSIDPIVTLGKQATCRLTVKNSESRALVMDYQPDYPSNLSGDSEIRRLRLPATEEFSGVTTVTPLKLGKTALGPLYIRVLGSYGLIWWNRRIEDQVAVLVEPDRLDRSALARGQVESGVRKTVAKPGAGYELLALREYRHGDPLHGIDWKATAKRHQSMVRIFNREQRLETAILIDCGRGGDIQYQLLDRLHHYVNIAARLSEYAVANGDQVACIAYADRILDRMAMGGGPAALQRIRKLLSGLSALPQESNPLALALELTHSLRHRSLIIFLTEMEHAEASGQLLQAIHLLSHKHRVLVASIEDDGIRSILKQPAEHWMSPYRNFAAREYLAGRELTRSKLLRSGVSVVSASPKHIDQEVLQLYSRLRENFAV